MAEPVFHQGAWWFQRPDGVWLRWDDATQAWQPPPAAQPPAGPVDPESPGAAAGPPPEVPTYRPLGGTATIVYVVTGIVLAITLASIASGALEVSLLGRIADGETVRQSEATNNDLRVGIIAVLQGLATIGAGVAFIVWFYRAHVNVRALGARGVRHGSGWAIGAWFIPFFNLVRPKSMANDVWRASDPSLAAPVERERWRGVELSGLLFPWWTAWVLSSLGNAVAGALGIGDDPGTLKASSEVTMVSDALLILAGVLMILVVRSTTARQDERLRAVSAAPA